MKNRALVVAIALALPLSLAACGNDDEAQAAEAISASMMEQEEDSFAVDQEQADCVGEGLVETVGVEQLQGYGMLTDDLQVDESVDEVTMSAEDADASAEVFVGCVDAQTMFAEEIAADEELTAEQQECIGEVMDEEALTELFSMMFQGKEDEAMEDLMGPLMACLF
ncbi:hypothetical protein [Ornithinimicrobium pekingense]|uniref:Uncharacterized protein n=1 Tax=Ornithinimicrobium pekingense TaxID=384677 RepID=A0ABQ2FEE3_9MICO|nr:hypothetical protein [Ornithinimicrobium pekingense]GGK79512.1 hypothetical protein GCM10011509_30030 [Ornithinimicrobium pekingense]